MLRHPWALLSLCVCAATALRAVAGEPGVVLHLLVCAAGVTLVGRAGVRAARTSRVAAVAWLSLAAGHGLWLVGDVLLALGYQVDPGDPLDLPVVVFGWSYAALAAGLLLHAARATAAHRVAAAVDGAITSTALLLLGLVLVVAPLIAADEHQLTVGASFLAGDIVLVALAVHLVAVQDRWSPAHALVGVGYLVVLLGDSGWLLGEAGSVAVVTAGVELSLLAWCAAAGERTSTPGATGQPRGSGLPTPGRPGPVRLLLLLAAAGLPTGVLALLLAPWLSATGPELAGPERPAWLVQAALAAGAVMTALVVARMSLVAKAAGAAAAESLRLHRALEHSATHDALTGTTGRAHLLELLAGALAEAQHRGGRVAVLFVDLDGFKAVNDALGHRAGDAVLRGVASRLRAAAREHDLVGRLGGDEFAVVLLDVAHEEEALATAQRVVASVGRPLTEVGRGVVVGASVGVAVSGERTRDAAELLHDADTAAYRAKATGRGRAVLFDDALRTELSDRAEAAAQLSAAATRPPTSHAPAGAGGLVHLFTPALDPSSGAVVGVEAVLRWQRPGGGLVRPSAVLPLADHPELVRALGRWALASATAHQAAWAVASADGSAPSVGVHLAGRHLAHPAVVDDVLEALAAAGTRADHLVVQVDECDLLTGADLLPALRRLRSLGVRVGLDGSSAGWTTLGLLPDLPCAVMRVDTSLVASRAAGAEELLALTVRAARASGLAVVVGGIITEEHEARAVAAGADLLQGPRWGAPRTAEQVSDLLGPRGRRGVLPLPASSR